METRGFHSVNAGYRFIIQWNMIFKVRIDIFISKYAYNISYGEPPKISKFLEINKTAKKPT